MAWANGVSTTLCLPDFCSRVFAAWGVPAREKEEAFPNRYDPAAQRTLTLDLRYVSRRVQCAYEVEDAGCEKKRYSSAS